MSNPSQLLPRTSIAATSFIKDGVLQLRVYTQDLEGGIRESRWNKGWSGGDQRDVIVRAKPNSPIAAFNYNNGDSIRVYYLSVDNVVSEIAQNNHGAWFAGGLNNARIQANPASRLAVIGRTWNNNYINVYYQRPDGRIEEISQDNSGWNRRNVVGDQPFIGSGLAAILSPLKEPRAIRVYYQLNDKTLAEAGIDEGGKWFNRGGFKSPNGAPTTEIAALSNSNDQNSFYVLFLNRQNLLTLRRHEKGVWANEEHPLDTTTSPGSGVAIITAHNENSLRVYVQNEDNRIQELVRETATSNWTRGAIIPTGPNQ
jgi:hypothetical protein